jgi:hypothetical protein
MHRKLALKAKREFSGKKYFAPLTTSRLCLNMHRQWF